MDTLLRPAQHVPIRNRADVLVVGAGPAGIGAAVAAARAGRPISGSFLAHAAYRVTGNCLAMGEAAGRAAAQAASQTHSATDPVNTKNIAR